MLLSRTTAYPPFRTVAALVGAILATGWLAERVGLTSADPAAPLSDLLVNQPVALAGGLVLFALACAVVARRPSADHERAADRPVAAQRPH